MKFCNLNSRTIWIINSSSCRNKFQMCTLWSAKRS